MSIEAIENNTNIKSTTETNGDGLYYLPSLHPGSYRVVVSKDGFKQIVQADVVLHVQDVLTLNFGLQVGSVHETMTVSGGAPLVNTESAAVSTVVDQKFVESMPLNGRSFQDLILLTPGVVTNSPQSPSSAGVSGEFSVNGQRTESNYYTVDGVSANTGIWVLPAVPSVSGSVAASTALGTTQSLVSVDALEEFRVQSSTYSAEYGRSPGGQFSFATRSGTNQWHGTAFDYLRNNFFDANDWFNGFLGQPEPPLRQNDFGGTFGGPVKIPRVYNGKDRTFFFFSYEELRLVQPQAASVSYVPDTALRQSTPAPLQQVLNAFPAQNGAEILDPATGNPIGLAEFKGTWSNPSHIDSYSVRLDHQLTGRLRLFFRFADTPSKILSRLGGNGENPAQISSTAFTARTYTLGATAAISSRFGNEFRLNYSSNEMQVSSQPDNFAGAQAVNLFQLQGVGTGSYPFVGANLIFGGFTSSISQTRSLSRQRQWNVTDAVSLALGAHQMKVGADFRRLLPTFNPSDPSVNYVYFAQSSVQSNSVDVAVASPQAGAYPLYSNFSAFAEDEWRATHRLNLSMGLRWEVNPAPGAARGTLPYTVVGNSLSTLILAAQGTPLWKTTWYNFAPRLGATFVFRNTPNWETVLRGGGGVFFDSGQQLGSLGYQGPGFSGFNLFGTLLGLPASFPAPPALANPPIINPPVAPYGPTWAFPSHLQLPFTLQWNASIEQALGASQALTVSYVGANGRRLLEQNEVNAGAFNPNFNGTISFVRNGLTSDYNALQVQFQRKFVHGLQALAAYTCAHSIDYGSQNNSLPYTRGNSDYDVRHAFSGAFSYDLPNAFQNSFARAVLNHWGLDDRFTARTSFPVTLLGNNTIDPVTGQIVPGELNLVPGQPIYISGSQCFQAPPVGLGQPCPGGRAINPNAFSLPPSGQAGDAPRNFTRGFGAWQMDLAARRGFSIYETLKLQFRAEAFNIFNHPNFGRINASYCPVGPGCTFGQATATLANSLGGLNPLYQTGGARSMQFALKLLF